MQCAMPHRHATFDMDKEMAVALQNHILPVAELCRKHGISDATFYTWRKKYAGLDASEARRLKALEDENARLKKLLAETLV